MTKISNLPRDLAEEVLSRIPITSLKKVRLTCKKWNTLSKNMSFAKKHLGAQTKVTGEAKEFMVVTMMDFRVYLMRVSLHNNNVQSCIKREGKVISLDDSDQIEIGQMFHCDGLLLCITKDHTRLVGWNMYLGRTRCIEPTHTFDIPHWYKYAIGYDKNSKSYKILRFIDHPWYASVEFKIYDFNSDSWRILDITPDWILEYYDLGVSLKGNMYWFAREKKSDDSTLLCFDFTREKFGPRLLLPFEPCHGDTVSLSNVREEQIAVLFQPSDTLTMAIWVTTTIEPNAVSWNNKVFLSANIYPQFKVPLPLSFFIDEEKKIAVVFHINYDRKHPTPIVAYIVGVDGTLKQTHLGESVHRNCFPLVCSYMPSLVQL